MLAITIINKRLFFMFVTPYLAPGVAYALGALVRIRPYRMALVRLL
ncbi:hypothetical protein HMPREF0004_3104 [Achromobacter piechaudii ATCC 43553]|uniref:Uncharacterized protein n=1 Tax=Achromobacter piechaudii ATCC 43553 TaxID=742159 RepID=D4XCA7_9BURK|nr:hypothetical protein HMPREF0004_3104 [Achromobacter piechaudii ATCC 43553]